MIRRIAVIGNSKQVVSLQKSLSSPDVQLVALNEAETVPENTDALISGSASKEALDAAIILTERNTTTLALLAEAIDCRESFKPESSQRVVEHATRFAEALGLSQDDQITLERGAQLRDIGKLKIPNEVLLKDGIMTYDEWTLIQKHADIGADLVSSIDGMAGIADIIRGHHESWDGDGYPNRLEKDGVAFLARVVKIIDVYCAMTSPRSYREGVATKEQAIDHLKAEREKHFDPELVDVFLDSDLGANAIGVDAS